MNKNGNVDIKGHGISDYGKTGLFYLNEQIRDLVNNCLCGTKPVLKCKYDDTTGWRETCYSIICTSCKDKNKVYETSYIDSAILEWNKQQLNKGK